MSYVRNSHTPNQNVKKVVEELNPELMEEIQTRRCRATQIVDEKIAIVEQTQHLVEVGWDYTPCYILIMIWNVWHWHQWMEERNVVLWLWYSDAFHVMKWLVICSRLHDDHLGSALTICEWHDRHTCRGYWRTYWHSTRNLSSLLPKKWFMMTNIYIPLQFSVNELMILLPHRSCS